MNHSKTIKSYIHTLFNHNRNMTILIALLWFNIVYYFSLFQKWSLRTLVENSKFFCTPLQKQILMMHRQLLSVHSIIHTSITGIMHFTDSDSQTELETAFNNQSRNYSFLSALEIPSSSYSCWYNSLACVPITQLEYSYNRHIQTPLLLQHQCLGDEPVRVGGSLFATKTLWVPSTC